MIVDTAVILAAGRGTRLGARGAQAPKGFLSLEGTPIVKQSIEQLFDAGIARVVVVTGHLAHFYAELAAELGRVDLVHNAAYATSGSLASLCLGGVAANAPFLLLESDIVYEPRALRILLDLPTAEAILVSGPTSSGDEVYVEADVDAHLVAMSKDRRAIGSVHGELVGISKISQDLFGIVAAASSTLPPVADYESGLVLAGRTMPIPCPLVSDLVWSEIDDESHLKRAHELIVPALRARRP